MSLDVEKNTVELNEKVEDSLQDGPPKSEVPITGNPDIDQFSLEERRRLIRRIDYRLLPIVGLLYCISLIDRTNLGSANIAGMEDELRLDIGMRYSIITLVFFPPYIVFEFPSTVVIRWLGPRIHLSGIALTWGILLIGMGLVNAWTTMVGLRVLMGILEAGFFPGCMYLLSTWYTRYQMHKRYAIWYFCGSMAAALSGILAFGIMQMDGIQGLGGWRWIFIIEGILTCTIAIVGYFVLVSFPDGKHKNLRFLDGRETRYIIACINQDRGDAEQKEKFTVLRFLSAGLDWKIWGFALIFGMLTTVTYSMAYFLPIILEEGMGFSVGAAQCLVAPPYFAAGILMYTTGWLGDKYHIRGPILLFNSIVSLVGLPVMGFASNLGVRYFGVFLTCMGANANIPASMTYQANNIRGHWKRAFCSATMVGLGGVGGIIGGLVFREQDSPKYYPGIYACMASQALIVITVIVLSIKMWRDNKKQAKGELIIENEVGFRYTL